MGRSSSLTRKARKASPSSCPMMGKTLMTMTSIQLVLRPITMSGLPLAVTTKCSDLGIFPAVVKQWRSPHAASAASFNFERIKVAGAIAFLENIGCAPLDSFKLLRVDSARCISLKACRARGGQTDAVDGFIFVEDSLDAPKTKK